MLRSTFSLHTLGSCSLIIAYGLYGRIGAKFVVPLMLSAIIVDLNQPPPTIDRYNPGRHCVRLG